MANFERGQIIAIPCKVFPGAFSHEAMVIIDTLVGEVSGFVRREDLTRIEDDHGYLRTRIVDVSEDTITVMLKGSFFTTTGLAEFSPDWTRSNAEVIAA
ncbi:MAG TPA: hypothetical protein VGB90_02300 [Alphaproteobacteria bacterium]